MRFQSALAPQDRRHASPLSGLRVIIVEDEVMIALALGDIAAELGCVVAGTATRLTKAFTLLEANGIDLAMLDINLDGVDVHPFADAAVARGIPIVFATGYGDAAIPAQLRGWPVVPKPFTTREVERGMLDALERARA